MNKITALSKKELKVIKGGAGRSLLKKKHRPLGPEDWNPDIGWEGEGPNGNQYFPG